MENLNISGVGVLCVLSLSCPVVPNHGLTPCFSLFSCGSAECVVRLGAVMFSYWMSVRKAPFFHLEDDVRVVPVNCCKFDSSVSMSCGAGGEKLGTGAVKTNCCVCVAKMTCT